MCGIDSCFLYFRTSAPGDFLNYSQQPYVPRTVGWVDAVDGVL